MTTTETRERPILFSGPMVRAILDGREAKLSGSPNTEVRND